MSGETMKVRHRVSNEIFLMKNVDRESYWAEAFLCELEHLQLLKNHSNIIRLIEAFNFGRLSYMVVEHFPSNLWEFILKNEIPKSYVQSFTYQICRGVSHCHEKSIMLRNIMPSNIFVTSNLWIKIGDLSLSKTAKNSRVFSSIKVGALEYRAPELLFAEIIGKHYCNYTMAIDVWSVGVSFLTIATRKLSLRGSDAKTMFNCIIEALGTPTSREWQSMDPNYTEHRKEIEEIAPEIRRSGLWKALCSYLECEEIYFAKEFLRYNPKLRISIFATLNHKYFDENNFNKLALPTGQWDGTKAVFIN
ncbi:unnamed protein product [Dracunculus medinensis]|uniref:Protein kinase domain-containing protein n=1 Tax=Dracunculus medinensis TaxID=318479 RepID=A0A158Q4K8_DRAME|nr:unnamed protein product [Dracunculus medinensis]